VCSDNKLIGMLSVHDIAVYLLAGGDNIKNKIKVSALMKSDFGYCYENDDVKKVREIMEKNEYMHLPVLTADKRLAGMVSLADLLTCEEVSKVSVNV